MLWGKLISLGLRITLKIFKKRKRKKRHALAPYRDDYYLEAYLSPLLGQGMAPFHSIPVFRENPTSETQAVWCTVQGKEHFGPSWAGPPLLKKTSSHLLLGSGASGVGQDSEPADPWLGPNL